MGNKYQQLTIEERCEISRLRTAGHSQRQIAASLDRAPSTVARELMRNSSTSTNATPVCSSPGAPQARPLTPSSRQWLPSWPPPTPVAPECHLRQRHRVRPASPTPCPGYPDLLLRCPLPLAERGGGERHRQNAPLPAPQDRPGHPDPGALLPTGPSLQQYPAQVPGV